MPQQKRTKKLPVRKSKGAPSTGGVSGGKALRSGARVSQAAAQKAVRSASRGTKVRRDDFDWDAFEASLARSSAGDASPRSGAGKASRAVDGALPEEELGDLRRLAARSRLVRSRSPAIGNVIFLHGITGSDLAVVDAKGDTDGIWVNAPRLVLGRIKDLKLDPSGRHEADASLTVQATGVNKRYYAKAVLTLRARWDVEPFAYDWRRDIDAASDSLAALVRSRFPKQPVHLVAHSMGGLVARNFIRRHPKEWDEMQGADLIAGGRLIMLGTPNYGSFAIPPVLTGGDQMMSLLATLDLQHSMAELLDITNTFVGSYMLLPAPSKLSSALQSLYQRETWGATPSVSQAHLSRAYQFFQDLEAGPSVDPRRMVYVAGCRRATFSGMTIVAPGEFEYKLSTDGDGRVPHELGLLKGVPTYYVDEVHGDLARNDQVLLAVDELLETGGTDELVTSPLRSRELRTPTMREYRSAADVRLMEELERVADKAAQAGGPETLTVEESQIAEDAIIKAALGTGTRSLPQALTKAPAVSANRRRLDIDPITLDVGVRFGDVTKIKAPVVVVGHYRGVQPVNAIGAIDAALDHWITRAIKQQMISGALGETFYVPTVGRIAAGAVVIGGMGEFGRFAPADLRLLMANVAIGAGAMGFATIASVVIGAGGGSLDRDVALMELLEGFGTGLRQLSEEKVKDYVPLKRLDLVENDPKRFSELIELIFKIADSESLSNLRIRAVKPDASELARARIAARARGTKHLPRTVRNASPPAFDEVRITVERPHQRDAEVDARTASRSPAPSKDDAPGMTTFRFSALTRTAVVPVREVTIQSQLATDTAEALRTSRTRTEQEKFGRLLYTYLMPEEFQELVDTPSPLKLIVDRSTASFPWEMACFHGRSSQGEPRWLGTDLRLSRQFRTTLLRAPGIIPPLNSRLRVLVIADPAPERELQLKGARAEGRRVVEILKAANDKKIGDSTLDVDVQHRIGAAECEQVEILALLLSGDFDIVHYAGHGDYDPSNPDTTGWVFGFGKRLTARDIFRARKVPRLVFANACFSGVVREGRAFAPDEMSQALATVAHAFFERGVPNFVGSGWPVDDAQALTMADRFYRALIQRKSIGDALAAGRRAIFDEQIESTWGAYQHYGDPNDTLLRPD